MVHGCPMIMAHCNWLWNHRSEDDLAHLVLFHTVLLLFDMSSDEAHWRLPTALHITIYSITAIIGTETDANGSLHLAMVS